MANNKRSLYVDGSVADFRRGANLIRVEILNLLTVASLNWPVGVSKFQTAKKSDSKLRELNWRVWERMIAIVSGIGENWHKLSNRFQL